MIMNNVNLRMQIAWGIPCPPWGHRIKWDYKAPSEKAWCPGNEAEVKVNNILD